MEEEKITQKYLFAPFIRNQSAFEVVVPVNNEIE